MPYLAALIAVSVLWLPGPSFAQHPNDSIDPRTPKPTPYGLQISRSDDGMAPPAPEDDFSDLPSLAPFLEEFEAAENDGGPYDFKLTEPLYDLGRAQVAAGRHTRAIKQFRRALHVERINQGLYSPSQLPILSDLIETYIAVDELDKADRLHAVQYDLKKRAYPLGSPEREEATREYVEWQRQAYLQSIGGDTFKRLLDMYDVHSEDIEFLEEQNPEDPALIPHLYNRLLVEYLVAQYNGEKQASLQINVSGPGESDPIITGQLAGERFRQLREYNFRNGLRTLDHIERIENAAEAPDAMAMARAKLAKGDWYLWWKKSSRALQNYEQAWALLSEDGSKLTDPDALFPHPVELPDTGVFLSDGTKPSEDVQARARVSLGITRDGRAREIEILEQQPPQDMGARVVLYRLLKEIRFRPVVREGSAVPFASLERVYRYQY